MNISNFNFKVKRRCFTVQMFSNMRDTEADLVKGEKSTNVIVISRVSICGTAYFCLPFLNMKNGNSGSPKALKNVLVNCVP